MLNSYGGSRCTVSDETSERGSIARAGADIDVVRAHAIGCSSDERQAADTEYFVDMRSVQNGSQNCERRTTADIVDGSAPNGASGRPIPRTVTIVCNLTDRPNLG